MSPLQLHFAVTGYMKVFAFPLKIRCDGLPFYLSITMMFLWQIQYLSEAADGCCRTNLPGIVSAQVHSSHTKACQWKSRRVALIRCFDCWHVFKDIVIKEYFLSW
jgi:hypothetical protein